MITLVGLGPGDVSAISLGARAALEAASELHQRNAGKMYLRTEKHPVVKTLHEWGFRFQTFDSLYDSLPDFDSIYRSIAEIVTSEAAGGVPVTYAVPGHPLFAEESIRQIRSIAAKSNLQVEIIASASFVEAALTAVGVELGSGCDVRDALTLPLSDSIARDGTRMPGRPDPTRGLLLYQVYDSEIASNTKLALMQDYPDEWQVVLVSRAGIKGEEDVRHVPLFRLDREPIDYLTSVYVPPLPPEMRRARFPELVGLMSRLRAPDGCPWDREQTPKTLRRYFIEETYEAIEAIDEDDSELLCEELGDVLLQVVFHAQLAAEDGSFNIDDVTDGIVRKLVRRHPHVFGTVEVADSAEVLRNWDRIKKDEKSPERRRESALDGVPASLPALMHAMEISKRAVKVGFEWGSLTEVLNKLDEELAELRVELSATDVDPDRVLSEIGDLLFTVVQIARWNRLDAEEALRSMIARFNKRFRHMEISAANHGVSLGERTPAELDVLWESAKRATE